MYTACECKGVPTCTCALWSKQKSTFPKLHLSTCSEPMVYIYYGKNKSTWGFPKMLPKICQTEPRKSPLFPVINCYRKFTMKKYIQRLLVLYNIRNATHTNYFFFVQRNPQILLLIKLIE